MCGGAAAGGHPPAHPLAGADSGWLAPLTRIRYEDVLDLDLTTDWSVDRDPERMRIAVRTPYGMTEYIERVEDGVPVGYPL